MISRAEWAAYGTGTYPGDITREDEIKDQRKKLQENLKAVGEKKYTDDMIKYHVPAATLSVINKTFFHMTWVAFHSDMRSYHFTMARLSRGKEKIVHSDHAKVHEQLRKKHDAASMKLSGVSIYTTANPGYAVWRCIHVKGAPHYTTLKQPQKQLRKEGELYLSRRQKGRCMECDAKKPCKGPCWLFQRK